MDITSVLHAVTTVFLTVTAVLCLVRAGTARYVLAGVTGALVIALAVMVGDMVVISCIVALVFFGGALAFLNPRRRDPFLLAFFLVAYLTVCVHRVDPDSSFLPVPAFLAGFVLIMVELLRDGGGPEWLMAKFRFLDAYNLGAALCAVSFALLIGTAHSGYDPSASAYSVSFSVSPAYALCGLAGVCCFVRDDCPLAFGLFATALTVFGIPFVNADWMVLFAVGVFALGVLQAFHGGKRWILAAVPAVVLISAVYALMLYSRWVSGDLGMFYEDALQGGWESLVALSAATGGEVSVWSVGQLSTNLLPAGIVMVAGPIGLAAVVLAVCGIAVPVLRDRDGAVCGKAVVVMLLFQLVCSGLACFGLLPGCMPLPLSGGTGAGLELLLLLTVGWPHAQETEVGIVRHEGEPAQLPSGM